MKSFYRLLKADCLKMKRTPFYLLHIIFPLIGVALFLGYYAITKWEAQAELYYYVQAILLIFPFIGAVVTTMVIEKEAEAGSFKEVLSLEYSKYKVFISKLGFLLMGALFSTTLAVGGFFIGFYYLLGQKEIGILIYIKVAGIILISQIVLYCWHMMLCFKTSKGVTLGVGILELLVAALLQTGLGDGIWHLVPCSWGFRLCDYYLKGYFMHMSFYKQIRGELLVILLITIGTIVFSLKAFYAYEGRKGTDI